MIYDKEVSKKFFIFVAHSVQGKLKTQNVIDFVMDMFNNTERQLIVLFEIFNIEGTGFVTVANFEKTLQDMDCTSKWLEYGYDIPIKDGFSREAFINHFRKTDFPTKVCNVGIHLFSDAIPMGEFCMKHKALYDQYDD